MKPDLVNFVTGKGVPLKRNKYLFFILLSLAVSLLLGCLISGLYGAETFWRGLPGAAFLVFASCLLLYAAWQVADRNKTVGWIMLAVYLIRLLLGVGFTAWLPEYGYDTPQQNAGYLFRDAYERDQESWGNNLSKESLWDVYWVGFDTDQYGGLLLIGAIIYRTFSSDLHRAALLLILSAFFAALAVPFLWKAIRHTWTGKLTNTALWIYALYPDSILFSSSQMREPYLFASSAMSFWAVQTWREHKTKSVIVFLLNALFIMLISAKVGMFIMAFLLVWFILVQFPPQKKWVQIGFVAGLIGGGIIIGLASWAWLKSTASWEVLVNIQNSGWVQKLVANLDPKMQIAFLTGYGLVQPLLPAAIAEPSIVLWKTIAITRALGWYLILPFIAYGVFSIPLEKDVKKRWLILWTAIFMIMWFVLSSARAGGDLWDNPRYRFAFLPWIGLFIAWAWETARKARNGWLIRWFVGIWSFVLLITHWYIGRYTSWFTPLDFKWYFVLFGIVMLVIIAQGIYHMLSHRHAKE